MTNPGPGGGDSDPVTFTVEPSNRPPVADAGADLTADEGDTVTLDASGSSDPDGDTLTYTWAPLACDWAGIGTLTGMTPALTVPDQGTCVLELQVHDGHVTDTDTVTVTGLNVAPSWVWLSGPLDPQQLGTTIAIDGQVTDPGVHDVITVSIDWGDGSTDPASVSGPASATSVSASHTYAQAGVYTVTGTAIDGDGGSATEVFRYVVVYDPDGGFVTGGGHIESPIGACRLTVLCGVATGKANFGFVAKYEQGAQTPTGQTQFAFRAGDLNFHSESYKWLVVAGSQAKYKGTGSVNGTSGYGFMLTAVDGEPDTFRMKIWDEVSGDVVYDNRYDAEDDSYAGTALRGGSIVVHKP